MCGAIRSVSLWRERSNYSRRLVEPVEIVSFDVSAQRGLISVSDCRYSFCERTAQALAESNTMSGCDVGAARDRDSHRPPCDKPRLAMRSQIDYFREGFKSMVGFSFRSPLSNSSRFLGSALDSDRVLRPFLSSLPGRSVSHLRPTSS